MKIHRVAAVFVCALLVMTWQAGAQTNFVTIDSAGSPAADVTDWADEYCVADDVCEDFNGGQSDAKGACIASDFFSTDPNTATTAYLRFDFNVTTINGANTVDGCWLVDSNQSGFVDSALCFSLTGNPLLLTQTNFYTCNDSSATTCGQDSQVTPSPAACAINNAIGTGDQILVCPADTADTAVECSVPLAALGWVGGNVSLLSSCTSTSAQANSSTFDCLADVNGPFVIDPDTGGNTPVELLLLQVE